MRHYAEIFVTLQSRKTKKNYNNTLIITYNETRYLANG